MYESLGKLTKAIEDAQREAREKAKGAFEEAFRELFAANPDLEAVRWTQYAPYFNDGEPCEFGVHGYSAKFPNPPKEAYPDDEGFVDDYCLEDSIREKVGEIFHVSEDLFKAAFGTDVEITATREGLSVEDYSSHD